jgi:hypothetical protein
MPGLPPEVANPKRHGPQVLSRSDPSDRTCLVKPEIPGSGLTDRTCLGGEMALQGWEMRESARGPVSEPGLFISPLRMNEVNSRPLRQECPISGAPDYRRDLQ